MKAEALLQYYFHTPFERLENMNNDELAVEVAKLRWVTELAANANINLGIK